MVNRESRHLFEAEAEGQLSLIRPQKFVLISIITPAYNARYGYNFIYIKDVQIPEGYFFKTLIGHYRKVSRT